MKEIDDYIRRKTDMEYYVPYESENKIKRYLNALKYRGDISEWSNEKIGDDIYFSVTIDDKKSGFFQTDIKTIDEINRKI